MTIYFEIGLDGQAEQVYPCLCGRTHRGDYAAYDYGHHNCSHFDKPLFIDTEMGNDHAPYQALCPLCGASFMVEFLSEEG